MRHRLRIRLKNLYSNMSGFLLYIASRVVVMNTGLKISIKPLPLYFK